MNRTSSNEVYLNGNPARSELMTSAERELSAFFSAVAERFGPQEAALAAKDWVRELGTHDRFARVTSRLESVNY